MSLESEDHALMEASLVALGDGYEGMAAELFDDLIAAHPQHAHAFLNPAAARERMTRETLEALLGLAEDAPWVATTVIDFVDLHRGYAPFTADDYADWFARSSLRWSAAPARSGQPRRAARGAARRRG